MITKAQAWHSRLRLSDKSTAGLAWGSELWKPDASLYEGAPGIAVAMTRAGKLYDDEDLVYYATSNLFADVIDAASGVERAHLRLIASMAISQSVYDEWQEQWKDNPDVRGRVGVRDPGASMDTIEDAWFSIEEMIIWARILDDRLKRRGPKRGAYQGLIPALADGSRRDAIIAARSRLLTSGLSEVRLLADLNLHSQPLKAGSKSARVRNGVLRLTFPDPVTAKPHDRSEFTYTADRDGVTFADGLMKAVTVFMDELFQALEDNLPPRFRVQSP